MRSLKIGFGGLLLGSLALLMAVPGWAEDDADVFEITVKDQDFKYEGTSVMNQTVVLPVGMEVSWLNVDPNITSTGLEGIQPHGVMVKNQNGNLVGMSKLLFQDNKTFNYKFNEPGLYSYQCFVHPHMKGHFLVFKVQLAAMTAEHHAAR